VWAWSVHTYAEQHPNPWYPIASFWQYWHFFCPIYHHLPCGQVHMRKGKILFFIDGYFLAKASVGKNNVII